MRQQAAYAGWPGRARGSLGEVPFSIGSATGFEVLRCRTVSDISKEATCVSMRSRRWKRTSRRADRTFTEFEVGSRIGQTRRQALGTSHRILTGPGVAWGGHRADGFNRKVRHHGSTHTGS